MKIINDQHSVQPTEKAVSRKTLDEWQRKGQARRVEAEQRDNSRRKDDAS
jgi:hypothetical protein